MMTMLDRIPVQSFVNALEKVVGAATHPVVLHEPEFGANEQRYVADCIASGWVSSAGKYVDQFEARIAEFTGARHAVVVSSGTAALHAALLIAGVKPGDEVLIPALTFVASANSAVHCGAVPHFIDSAEDTLGVCPDALGAYLSNALEPAGDGFRNRKTGRRVAAIVPMHTFGHPVRMDELLEVAGRYKVTVVEDAAESLGSSINGRHTGTFGVMGTLSFNGNKIVTTGGGGAILTDDAKLAEALRQLTATAKRPHRWEFIHDQVSYNYRMPNLNAALGCAQFDKLPQMLEQKRVLANRYIQAFGQFAAGHCVVEPVGTRSNYWLNAFKLASPDRDLRDAMLDASFNAGYHCRPAWELMHRLPMFMDAPRAPLPVAERLADSIINLPSSPKLAEQNTPHV
jgi:perosamine synthetase